MTDTMDYLCITDASYQYIMLLKVDVKLRYEKNEENKTGIKITDEV